MAGDSIVGHASSSEVGQAAYTMLQTCVIERGMGGLAFNLGKSVYHSKSACFCSILIVLTV